MAKQEAKANDDVQISHAKRHLRVDFTEDELKQFGSDLAREGQMKADAADRKKSVNSQIKAEMDGHAARETALRVKINNGYEYRDVPVTITKDLKHGTYTEVRDDTQEQVTQRTLTAEEMQAALPLKDGEE